MAEDIKDLERIYKAFANRRRLAIIRLIKKEREMTVGAIAARIHLSFTATSKHLGVLATANILDREQRSLEMYYRIASDLHPHAKQIIALF